MRKLDLAVATIASVIALAGAVTTPQIAAAQQPAPAPAAPGVPGTAAKTAVPKAPAAPTAGTEAQQHPRIANAIRALESAVTYMQAAPHDFGGHKAKAIQDSKGAITELRAALKFRAQQDAKAAAPAAGKAPAAPSAAPVSPSTVPKTPLAPNAK